MGSKSNRSAEVERMFLVAYDENADALFRHALARVRNRELAKDLVQEAFTRTWSYLADGKHVDHVRAFLYRTLNNAIIDMSRRKKSASLDEMHEEDGFEVVDDSYVPPAEIREETRAAMKLVSTLDEMYATAVTLRYIEGLSPKEISEVLNVTENVVSVRIHRGLNQLRKLWHDQHTS